MRDCTYTEEEAPVPRESVRAATTPPSRRCPGAGTGSVQTGSSDGVKKTEKVNGLAVEDT